MSQSLIQSLKSISLIKIVARIICLIMLNLIVAMPKFCGILIVVIKNLLELFVIQNNLVHLFIVIIAY